MLWKSHPNNFGTVPYKIPICRTYPVDTAPYIPAECRWFPLEGSSRESVISPMGSQTSVTQEDQELRMHTPVSISDKHSTSSTSTSLTVTLPLERKHLISTHLPLGCWSGAGGSEDYPLCCWRRWQRAHTENTAAARSLPLRSSCHGPPPPSLSPSLSLISPLFPPRGAVFQETSGPFGDPSFWCRSDREADKTD